MEKTWLRIGFAFTSSVEQDNRKGNECFFGYQAFCPMPHMLRTMYTYIYMKVPNSSTVICTLMNVYVQNKEFTLHTHSVCVCVCVFYLLYGWNPVIDVVVHFHFSFKNNIFVLSEGKTSVFL